MAAIRVNETSAETMRDISLRRTPPLCVAQVCVRACGEIIHDKVQKSTTSRLAHTHTDTQFSHTLSLRACQCLGAAGHLCVTAAQRPSFACLKIRQYCWENDFGGERGPLAFQSR